MLSETKIPKGSVKNVATECDNSVKISMGYQSTKFSRLAKTLFLSLEPNLYGLQSTLAENNTAINPNYSTDTGKAPEHVKEDTDDKPLECQQIKGSYQIHQIAHSQIISLL